MQRTQKLNRDLTPSDKNISFLNSVAIFQNSSKSILQYWCILFLFHRTAIHSLVFRNTGYKEVVRGANYIPPNRFNTITVGVIVITLFIGIMIPDIEFVLGLVGSTIGNVVCILLPSGMI